MEARAAALGEEQRKLAERADWVESSWPFTCLVFRCLGRRKPAFGGRQVESEMAPLREAPSSSDSA